ncbi:hypothetical protein [Erythrobacter sp.]|uniref:hypothetical protein n=1 Tax=Erythrobacter sp. TaxID=1042 RepID=UPI001425E07B|nr:hypothetical protein [Erythrobacter sp.]QIQ85779.1 MAG: hypothetical protein G9473_03055 [Erythrobacter sp.]
MTRLVLLACAAPALALSPVAASAVEEVETVGAAAERLGCETVEYGAATSPDMPAWSDDAAFYGKALASADDPSVVVCEVERHPDRVRGKLRVGERITRAGQTVTIWHGRMGGRRMVLEVEGGDLKTPQVLAECSSKRSYVAQGDVVECDQFLDFRKVFYIRSTLLPNGATASVLRFVDNAAFTDPVDPGGPATVSSSIGSVALVSEGRRFGKAFAMEGPAEETSALLGRWIAGQGAPVTLTYRLTDGSERKIEGEFTAIAPTWNLTYAMARLLAGD